MFITKQKNPSLLLGYKHVLLYRKNSEFELLWICYACILPFKIVEILSCTSVALLLTCLYFCVGGNTAEVNRTRWDDQPTEARNITERFWQAKLRIRKGRDNEHTKTCTLIIEYFKCLLLVCWCKWYLSKWHRVSKGWWLYCCKKVFKLV